MIQARWAAILAPWLVALAQQVDPKTSGDSRSSRPPNPFPVDPANPTFLSGRVAFSDGSAPSAGVTIQRVCGVSVTAVTHADSRGRFTLQLGRNRDPLLDSSSSPVPRDNDSGSCELRASLPGYRSDPVSLGNRRSFDDSSVGTIILHPLSSGSGFTISATTGLAPKQARKAYENGIEALRHNNPDGAQTGLWIAVEIYPRFAEAWFALGQIYERRSHPGEARRAYTSAIAADANYVNPYERLYLLDVKEARWPQAVDNTRKVLRLDPFEYPGAYYFNALAHYQLQQYDAAERSAREAVGLQGAQAEPAAHYLLGIILAGKGEFTGAAENLTIFLKTAPEDPDRINAQRILSGIEARARPAHAADPKAERSPMTLAK